MRARGLAAVGLAILVAAGGCSSSAATRSALKPCRILRLADARALLGADATRAPLSGPQRAPACTYVLVNHNENPPSLVLHIDPSHWTAKLSRIAESPSAKRVPIPGLVGNALWTVQRAVPVSPNGSPTAAPQVVGGTLVFARDGLFVQIDAGGTANNLAHAKGAARLVIPRIS